MHIKSQKDFFSGLLFVCVGVAFAWGATTYNVGQGARMGPGYFPLMLGVVLALIGAVVLFTSLVVEVEGGDKIGKWAWRPLFFIILANLAFGVLLAGLPSIKLPAMGMIAAIYGLVFIASLADRACATADPGEGHPHVADGNALCIWPDGHHLAGNFMAQGARWPQRTCQIDLVAATQIKVAVLQMHIAVANTARLHPQNHLAALGCRCFPQNLRERLAKLFDLVTQHGNSGGNDWMRGQW